MATYKTLVESYIGTFSNTDLLDLTLTEGARIVIDKLADEKDRRLDLYAIDKVDAASGIEVTGGRVIKAHKSGYEAMKIDSANLARYSLSGSIFKATATDPVWYSLKTKAYIIPGGGTAVWAEYPTIANGDTIGATGNFPPEADPIVILYSSIHCQLSIISTLIATTMAGLIFTNPTNVTPPSAPSFTYTDATGTTVELSAVNITRNLTFTPPVFGGSYTGIDSALGNADVELVKAYGAKLTSQLNQYQNDLQNAISDFNKESKQYDNDLQKAISQAGIDAQRASAQAALTQDLKLQNEINDYRQDVEEYQADLGKYQADIGDFVAQVNESATGMTTQVQRDSAMYQGYFALVEKLKQEYVEALGVL